MMVDLSRMEKAEKILEAIPRDRWVSALEIAAVVNLTPNKVGGVIRSSLIIAHVERKPVSHMQRHYLYRRLGKTKSGDR